MSRLKTLSSRDKGLVKCLPTDMISGVWFYCGVATYTVHFIRNICNYVIKSTNHVAAINAIK